MMFTPSKTSSKTKKIKTLKGKPKRPPKVSNYFGLFAKVKPIRPKPTAGSPALKATSDSFSGGGGRTARSGRRV